MSRESPERPARSRRRDGGDPLPTRRRQRHRSLRGSVAGPYLPRVTDRIDDFEAVLDATVEYLEGLWPDELRGVRIESTLMPSRGGRDVPRWAVDRKRRLVLLYRLPIERFGRFGRADAQHRRMIIESYVFRAVAEYLGKDPWELTPERFRLF